MEVLGTQWLAAAGVAVRGVFGLLVGSFLNVVVWRVPRGESVVSPPSACPACGHRIRARDNVPILSWVVLRGRCRDCGGRIGVRYPLVEAATCLLFVLVALRLGWSAALPAYLYLAALGLALSLIDLDANRLPNAMVLPAYPVLAVLLTAASSVEGDWTALVRAAVAGGALWALYFGLMAIRPGGMGFGDVKLAGVLGAGLGWLGWGPVVVGTFGAFLLGGGFAVGLLLTGRAGRTSRVPFGPWMVLGAALGMAVGTAAWAAYLGVIAPAAAI